MIIETIFIKINGDLWDFKNSTWYTRLDISINLGCSLLWDFKDYTYILFLVTDMTLW